MKAPPPSPRERSLFRGGLLPLYAAVFLFGLAGLFGKWLLLGAWMIVFGRVAFAALTLALLWLPRRLQALGAARNLGTASNLRAGGGGASPNTVHLA